MPLPAWLAQLSGAQLSAALGGRFSTPQPLGAGGQGTVFRATGLAGPAKGHDVALKLYDPSGNPIRVDREFRALRGQASPHLADALDEGKVAVGTNSARWVAWKFIDGESLRQLLARGHPFSPQQVAKCVNDVAAAVELLWSLRIVHRDIKPDNILFEQLSGNYVLVDLGLARFVNEVTITGSGWCGTPGYMSPEQALGERRLTSLSDVFCLGVTACEMIDGLHPVNYSQVELMHGKPNLVSRLVKPAPAWKATLEKMLQHDAPPRPAPQDVRAAVAAHI